MSKEKVNNLSPDLWVDKYADYLFNFTITRVRDVDVVKDLIQETFFAGLKSMSRYEGKASERTWLISILKRKIVDHYRRSNSNKGRAEVRMNFYSEASRQGDWIEESVSQTGSNRPDAHLEAEELGQVLSSCIKKLSKRHKTVFEMKTLQDFETDEICKVLKINPPNFWVILHRARIQLRKCMEDHGFKR